MKALKETNPISVDLDSTRLKMAKGAWEGLKGKFPWERKIYSLEELLKGDSSANRPPLKLVDWRDEYHSILQLCNKITNEIVIVISRRPHALLDSNGLVIGYLLPGAADPQTWGQITKEATEAFAKASEECPLCQYSVRGTRGSFRTLTVGATLSNNMPLSISVTRHIFGYQALS